MIGATIMQAAASAPVAAQARSEGAAAPRAGQARTEWFSGQPAFRPLIADPNEPRNTAALLYTDLLLDSGDPAERPPFELVRSDGRDLQGAVGLGFSQPVVSFRGQDSSVIDVGWMVTVFSRFRLEEPSRDELLTDWYVGVPITVTDGALSGRFRLLHHSSHMGDEAQEQGARRIEYSWEGVDALVAYEPLAHTRVYGGGTVVLRNNSYVLVRDRFGDYGPVTVTEKGAIQAGAETGWFGWAGGRAGLVAAVDYQAADRSSWRAQWSFAAGPSLEYRALSGKLLVRCFHGPSAAGEFFLTEENYCGLEFQAHF